MTPDLLAAAELVIKETENANYSLGQRAVESARLLARHVKAGMDETALAQLEITADKLSDVWLHLDSWARGEAPSLDFIQQAAQAILRNQQAPGWATALGVEVGK